MKSEHIQKIRTLSAFSICVFGIALMDYAFHVLRPRLTASGDGTVDATEFEALEQFTRLKPIAETGFIAIIAFVAFLVSRPNRRSNNYKMVIMIVVALTIGRSFLGIGEGFSTELLWTALLGIFLGFTAYHFAKVGRKV